MRCPKPLVYKNTQGGDFQAAFIEKGAESIVLQECALGAKEAKRLHKWLAKAIKWVESKK